MGKASRKREERRQVEEQALPAPPPPPPHWWIVSPAYDWIGFILPPLIALAAGFAISFKWPSKIEYDQFGVEKPQALTAILIGTLIHAHLVAVFVRSHNNPSIFKLYPWRFTLVPIAIWLAILGSPWIAVAAAVVATFWDVWHSGAQTFGFARIYDRNAGNPPEMGRRLDFWLNQLMYAGPVLAGVVLVNHLEPMEEFANKDVNDLFFASVPAKVLGVQRYITGAVIGVGTAFLLFYVFWYWRLWKKGYRFPFHKVFLLVTTGLCSIYTWGFNTWGEAFFIMNLFHGWQYLALVWAMEHKRITERIGLATLKFGKAVAAAVFFGAVFLYGYGAAQIKITDNKALWGATIVVSLMHFWYDGFVWSVRKGQV